jgi:hypothetical protein
MDRPVLQNGRLRGPYQRARRGLTRSMACGYAVGGARDARCSAQGSIGAAEAGRKSQPAAGLGFETSSGAAVASRGMWPNWQMWQGVAASCRWTVAPSASANTRARHAANAIARRLRSRAGAESQSEICLGHTVLSSKANRLRWLYHTTLNPAKGRQLSHCPFRHANVDAATILL